MEVKPVTGVTKVSLYQVKAEDPDLVAHLPPAVSPNQAKLGIEELLVLTKVLAVSTLPLTNVLPKTSRLADAKTSAPMLTLFKLGCAFSLRVLSCPVPPKYGVTLVAIWVP
jgi:hypothetical protein